MKKPDYKYEEKILLDVIEQMEAPEETEKKQSRFKQSILALGVTGLMIAFFLALNEIIHPVMITVVAVISGALIGFGLMLEFLLKQWPVTRQHINMESIQQRLDHIRSSHSDD